MEGRPPGTEGSCEYIEQAVADSRQGMVSSLGVGRGAATSHRKNFLLLRNISKRLTFGIFRFKINSETTSP
jgi:hypothetical protein